MIGEQFTLHFLVFRYLIVLVLVLGLWAALWRRSTRLVLCALALLGMLTWWFTWLPLERSYGLQPGSPSSFEVAVVTVGAANDTPLESWVVGRRNPRPAWSLAWHALAPGRPDRARRMHEFVPAVTLALLPLVVYLAFRSRRPDGSWEALSCVFAAAFASSVPLDAFRPFGLFQRSIFVAPAQVVGLLIVLAALGLAGRGRGWLWVVDVVLLGTVAWLDLGLFVWGVIGLLAGDVLKALHAGRVPRDGSWRAVVLAGLLAAPQLLALYRSELLTRGPSPEDFESMRIAFRDLFAATTDMEWIFVLAVVSVPILWKRREPADLGILSLLVGSYGLWVAAATQRWGPLLDPNEVFHLLRFSVALAAGVGGFRVADWILERLRTGSREGSLRGRLARWARKAPSGPAAFALVVLFLLPNSAAFLWRPLRMDPLYYPSLRPVDPALQRLGSWVRANTRPDETILTGDHTGEWVAALSGRRVYSALRVLPRDERRVRNREMRTLFLSGEPAQMREAWVALGASVLVLDASLGEVYWQMDRSALVSSGLFRKVHQIGDVYAIYRAR